MNIDAEVELFVNIEKVNAIFASALFQIRGALGREVAIRGRGRWRGK
jgi:hypothetical protein